MVAAVAEPLDDSVRGRIDNQVDKREIPGGVDVPAQQQERADPSFAASRIFENGNKVVGARLAASRPSSRASSRPTLPVIIWPSRAELIAGTATSEPWRRKGS